MQVEGAKRTLDTYKPTIVCELHPGIEPKVLEIFDTLIELGYRCYDVKAWSNENPPPPLQGFDGVHHFIAISDQG